MIKNIKGIAFLSIILILSVCCVFVCNKMCNQTNAKKKLTFWSIQLKPIYEKQMNNIIQDFEKKHPDYKIVWVDVPIQEAQKRTLASILSSTPPDLINLNPDFSHILAQRNVLEFFADEQMSKYHSGLVDKLKLDGKIYGIPFYATSPVTIYNKEVFNKCIGGEFPKTYHQLYSISSDLFKCSNTPVLGVNLNENDTFYRILNKYGVQSFKSSKNQEKTYKIYLMFNNMYKYGYMPKDTLTINHREVIEKYMSNQATTIVAGTNFIKMIKQNAPEMYAKTAIAPQLRGDNEKYDVSLMNLVIPKKSKNKEIAREFAFELTNSANQLELAKITNVLPSNLEALADNYFKNCSADLEQMSRCQSVKQLNDVIAYWVEIKDKKTLNEFLNKSLEEILLDENSNLKVIKGKIAKLFPYLNSLIGQD